MCPMFLSNPHNRHRSLAPQASASAYSATRTRCADRVGWLRLANLRRLREPIEPSPPSTSTHRPRQPRPKQAAHKRLQAKKPSTSRKAKRPQGQPPKRRWHDGTVTENQVNQANHANQTSSAEEEVVAICRDLIRIDTTNPGDHSGPGERRAAEYVAGLLSEVGLAPEVLESHPKRTSLVARIEGEDRSRPGLLIHGHLDVVPRNANDWRQHPFGGEIQGGCVWGRGAVDMKDMDLIMLAVTRARAERGPQAQAGHRARVHRRRRGGRHLGCPVPSWSSTPTCSKGSPRRSARSAGSVCPSVTSGFTRVQTAEKGIAWMRLTAHGHRRSRIDDPQRQRGHHRSAEAIARVGRYQWPTHSPPRPPSPS